MTFTLPELPYDYSALEPAISQEIMEIHHKKHHQAYITNLNAALEQYKVAEEKQQVEEMIALQSAIKFNGGGYVNHCLFWKNLAPKGQTGEMSGGLKTAIEHSFGSVDNMKQELSKKSIAIQGSGWGWLAFNIQKKSICIVTTQNQDPLSTTGHIPLLGIDVWEHAYYLQYKNVRPDYVKAIWEVINWNEVNKRFESIAEKA
ncbi:MAG: Superoxide dismutase [Mn/Fe] [Chlamydiae bacterium]|nr:Superoxide dismutase [Mn/Fe] [Chlamydiota bacterium]